MIRQFHKNVCSIIIIIHFFVIIKNSFFVLTVFMENQIIDFTEYVQLKMPKHKYLYKIKILSIGLKENISFSNQ